jgi:S-adenosylmethionine:tRNA ribosyltransferase-isomerase
MKLSSFDYSLPPELIAQQPTAERDRSRLLVLDRSGGSLSHRHFHQLPEYLAAGDVLVFNDTRVIPARLMGSRPGTGGKVEVFLLSQLTDGTWEVLVKPGRKLQPGAKVIFSDELSCEVLAATDFGGRIVRFVFDGIFSEIIDRLGETPLPPYIHSKLADKERYQTVYARERGSAAAPTAGLHFTPELLQVLSDKGVKMAFLTLHVGLGTFRPVEVDDVTSHKMHKEFYTISADTAALINVAKEQGGRVLAVGTTAVRTLETVARRGIIQPGGGWTDIFIYPGYVFQAVDGLVTNFHLPKSSLLMLVSAFAGQEPVMAAYHQAITAGYRFFSFGDAMLIL